MKLKLNVLENNHTWKNILKPKDKHIVDCKWLYKVKNLHNGCIKRYKARLVVRAFTQTYGLNYFETYVPVAKMTTVRVLTVITVYHNWNITQLDVTDAFLHKASSWMPAAIFCYFYISYHGSYWFCVQTHQVHLWSQTGS